MNFKQHSKRLFKNETIKVAINLGNPVLAKKDENGHLSGISVNLAKYLADLMGLKIEWIVYSSAREVVEASKYETWDIAFLAIDPLRTEHLDYTSPYLMIEGTYLVRSTSNFKKVEELDRSGVSIAVGRGAAYDLELTRQLKKATLRRVETTPMAVDAFVKQNLTAAAGIRQPLEDFCASNPEYRVLKNNFMSIRQAVAYSKRIKAIGSSLETAVKSYVSHKLNQFL